MLKYLLLIQMARGTLEVIRELNEVKVKLNITAIFTINQIKYILPTLEKSEAIISVFAGRLLILV